MQSSLKYFVSAAALLLAMPASAQFVQATGLYVGAGAGVTYSEDSDVSVDTGGNDDIDVGDVTFDVGPVGVVALGYDFGSFRVEAEAGLRVNNFNTFEFDGGEGEAGEGDVDIEGYQRAITVMANGYYDLEFGSPLVPYLGAGVGVGIVEWDFDDAGSSEFDTQFAYQGIAGIAYNFDPQLAVTLEYRYLGMTDLQFDEGGGIGNLDATFSNHSGLLGLRYTFAPPPPVPVIDDTVVVTARSYLVFFDFDRYDLTPEARGIVASAAADALQGNSARIDVTGNTDRAGSVQYNLALGQRRADSVKRDLIANGVAESLIVTRSLGESDPLVPTADGVREPQNRRVEIVIN